jgi:hypothetical protein
MADETPKEKSGWDSGPATGVVSHLKRLVSQSGTPFNKAWLEGSQQLEAMGIAPRGFTRAGKERLQEVEANEERHPNWAMAGALASGVTSAYLGGRALQAAGASSAWVNPASQLVSGIKAGRLGQVGLATVAGATEGAAFSALDAGAEQASRDYLATGKISDDHVKLARLEGAKWGGILGGGFGGGLNILGQALPKAGRKVLNRSGDEWMRRQGVPDPAKVLGEDSGLKGLELFDAVTAASKKGKPAKLSDLLTEQVEGAQRLGSAKLREFDSVLDGATQGNQQRIAEVFQEEAERSEAARAYFRNGILQKPGAGAPRGLERLQGLRDEAAHIIDRMRARGQVVPEELLEKLEYVRSEARKVPSPVPGEVAQELGASANHFRKMPDPAAGGGFATGASPAVRRSVAHADTAPVPVLRDDLNTGAVAALEGKAAAAGQQLEEGMAWAGIRSAKGLPHAPPDSLLAAREAVPALEAQLAAISARPPPKQWKDAFRLWQGEVSGLEKQLAKAREALEKGEDSFAKASYVAGLAENAQGLAGEAAAAKGALAALRKLDAQDMGRLEAIAYRELPRVNRQMQAEVTATSRKMDRMMSRLDKELVDSGGKRIEPLVARAEELHKLRQKLAPAVEAGDFDSALKFVAEAEKVLPVEAKALRETIEQTRTSVATATALAEAMRKTDPDHITFSALKSMALRFARRSVSPIGMGGLGLYAAGPVGLGMALAGGYAQRKFAPNMYTVIGKKMGALMSAVNAKESVEGVAAKAVKGLTTANWMGVRGMGIPAAIGYKVGGAKRDEQVYEDLLKIHGARSEKDVSTLQAKLESLGLPGALQESLLAKEALIAVNIQKRAPKPVVAGAHPRFSDVEVEGWGEYVQAARDPMTAVKALGQGQLTRQGALALRENYPDLVKAIQDAVLDQPLEELDEQAARKLALLLDMPLTVVQSKDNVQFLQRAHDQMNRTNKVQDGSQGGGSAPSDGGVKSRNINGPGDKLLR